MTTVENISITNNKDYDNFISLYKIRVKLISLNESHTPVVELSNIYDNPEYWPTIQLVILTVFKIYECCIYSRKNTYQK